MANPAPGFAQNPGYRVALVPEDRHVKVVFAGVTIADSNHALRVEETGHAPVHYVPEGDVRMDLLRPTEHHTRCPYKGEASYWTIEVPADGGVRRSENAVWAYPKPYDEVEGLAGYYAFYGSRVDAITVG
ncbi:MAG TPA: DUF427 domain-containing protein [Stellaceae bacterium]|nr:DUF427 domain-containing protein [Stellaceae bacterium]